jgi:hypothetical protein
MYLPSMQAAVRRQYPNALFAFSFEATTVKGLIRSV